MRRHSAWHFSCRPAYRHLAYDTSPQHGTEMFGAVERLTLERDIHAHYLGGAMPHVY